MDMTSEGLGEMFQGDSADMCAGCRWGAEWRVSCAQTLERGPTSALAEIDTFILAVYSCKRYTQQYFMHCI